MWNYRIVVCGLAALCLAIPSACTRDIADGNTDTQARVSIDHAPLPHRYSASLPATAEGMQAWMDGDTTLPPMGHVVDLLLAGDPSMLSRLEQTATTVPAAQAGIWIAAWRKVLRFKSGTPAFCSTARQLIAGTAKPLRDVLAEPYAATCHGPEDVRNLLRQDTPYWAVIVAYQSEDVGHPAPADSAALVRAAQQALAAGDYDQLRQAAWTLAYRPEPEAWAALRAMHTRIQDREQANEIAIAFFRTNDPQLHDIAWRACADMQRPHLMCKSGPENHESIDDLEAPSSASSPTTEIASMQRKLAELGFSRVADIAVEKFKTADATSMLAVAGHVHEFDAETGQFPNEHDSLLRTLAALVQPALVGAVFEEVYPAEGLGPYSLAAYLDGKRYQISAHNLGDWYDIEAVLQLLNTILAERGRAERFAPLHTDDQIVWIVGGPQPSIQKAFEIGLLQPGYAGAAEASGKAFEEEFLKQLSD